MKGNIMILVRENNIYRLKMTESIFICTNKPSINIHHNPVLHPTKRQRAQSSTLIG